MKFSPIPLKLYVGSRNQLCEKCIIFEMINPNVDKVTEGMISAGIKKHCVRMKERASACTCVCAYVRSREKEPLSCSNNIIIGVMEKNKR